MEVGWLFEELAANGPARCLCERMVVAVHFESVVRRRCRSVEIGRWARLQRRICDGAPRSSGGDMSVKEHQDLEEMWWRRQFFEGVQAGEEVSRPVEAERRSGGAKQHPNLEKMD